MEVSWGGIVFLAVIVQVVVFGWFGSWVAKQCGRDGVEGFVLGALFGAFGVLIEGLLPKFPYEKQVRDARSSAANSSVGNAASNVVRDEAAIQEWLRTH